MTGQIVRSRLRRGAHAFHTALSLTLSLSLGGAAFAEGLPEGKRSEAKSPASTSGYEIRPVVSLGGADAPESAQFYERMGRTDVGADRAGNMYVLDSGGPRVQVFDSKGTFLRTIGKEGEGPGEFKIPGRLAVSEDGSVAVFDIGNHRISVFDAQGKLVRDQLVDGLVKEMTFDGNGHLVCALGGPGGDAIEAFDAAGKSLWAVRPPARQHGGRQVMMDTDEETSGARLVSAGNGVFYATREAYGVRRVASGKVESTWSRPFERRDRPAMPMRDKDDEGEEGDGPMQIVVVRREGGGGSGGDAAPQVSTGGSAQWNAGEEQITLTPEDIHKMMPKYRPDVRGLVAWPDGRLWVLTAEDEGANLVADEWSAAGEWSKRFTLPREYGLYKMGADGQLYGITHDADDYPVVHRLSVTAKS